VRVDPLTGYIPCIYVNGGFGNAYNLFAIGSASSQKISPVASSIGQDNGNAALFLPFIEFLLQNGWFEHGIILIMDNTSIRMSGEADIVEGLLWNTIQVLVMFLPTRSPELNPIELVFRILARCI
jgi:hypothetical protein